MHCVPSGILAETAREGEMSDHADLPIIQCKPGPTDAELQTERDIAYARDLAAFEAEQRYIDQERELDMFLGFDHIPAWKVRG